MYFPMIARISSGFWYFTLFSRLVLCLPPVGLDASPREPQGCFPRSGPETAVPLCESSFPILPIVGQPRQQRQRDARACAAAAWNNLCEVTRAVRILSNQCVFETNGTQDFRNVGFMKVLSNLRYFSVPGATWTPTSSFVSPTRNKSCACVAALTKAWWVRAVMQCVQALPRVSTPGVPGRQRVSPCRCTFLGTF